MNKLPLLAAALVATFATLCHSPAWSQGFALEGAIIDSRTGQSLGVVTEKGDLNALFRAQKAMTFGILRSAGISLEQLSPEVRARIERFQTTNVDAFRAFSQGLDLKDQGKFAQAREQFKRAAELDPNFALASEQQQSMPDVNLGSGLQVRAVMQAVAGAAVDKGKATFVVDVARAAAAIQAGQTVVTVAAPPTEAAVVNDYKFSSNRPAPAIALAPTWSLAWPMATPQPVVQWSIRLPPANGAAANTASATACSNRWAPAAAAFWRSG